MAPARTRSDWLGHDMEINELLRIEAIGNLLQYYRADLTYISRFHQYKDKALPREEFLSKSPGSFRSFLTEFKVGRWIPKEEIPDVLELTMKWVRTKHADDVDGFACRLMERGLTRGKIMTSLASKIMFLNRPQVILPCDRLNRKALDVKRNRYSDFSAAFERARQTLQINGYLEPVQGYLRVVEAAFEGEFDDIRKIRENRFLDKLLWVCGRTLLQNSRQVATLNSVF